jgi:hypothetical protein
VKQDERRVILRNGVPVTIGSDSRSRLSFEDSRLRGPQIVEFAQPKVRNDGHGMRVSKHCQRHELVGHNLCYEFLFSRASEVRATIFGMIRGGLISFLPGSKMKD